MHMRSSLNLSLSLYALLFLFFLLGMPYQQPKVLFSLNLSYLVKKQYGDPGIWIRFIAAFQFHTALTRCDHGNVKKDASPHSVGNPFQHSGFHVVVI